jgi:hypothetical protein
MREHTDTGAGLDIDTGAVAVSADSTITGLCDGPSIALHAAFGAGTGAMVGAVFGAGLANVAPENGGAGSIVSIAIGASVGASVGSANNGTLRAADDNRFRCATTCAAGVFAGVFAGAGALFGTDFGSKIDAERRSAIYGIFGATFAALVVGFISHVMLVSCTASSARDSDNDIDIGRPANIIGVPQNIAGAGAGAGAPSGSHESRCNQRAASSFTR